MAYASIADFDTFGLPAASIANMTNTQKQGAINAAAATMDGYFRARYTLPFTVNNDANLTRWNIWIAQYLLLCVRGFNPSALADKTVKDNHDRAIMDCIEVRDQKSHLNVVDSSTTQYNQPVVLTTPQRLVYDPANGRRGAI